jgi:hypothetical protein
MHELMCIVLDAVVIALCRAIRVVCLHDVSMIAIGVEGADQGEAEPSHHHVAPGMSLPYEPSQSAYQSRIRVLGAGRAAFRLMMAFSLHMARPPSCTFGRS